MKYKLLKENSYYIFKRVTGQVFFYASGDRRGVDRLLYFKIILRRCRRERRCFRFHITTSCDRPPTSDNAALASRRRPGRHPFCLRYYFPVSTIGVPTSKRYRILQKYTIRIYLQATTNHKENSRRRRANVSSLFSVHCAATQ